MTGEMFLQAQFVEHVVRVAGEDFLWRASAVERQQYGDQPLHDHRVAVRGDEQIALPNSLDVSRHPHLAHAAVDFVGIGFVGIRHRGKVVTQFN